MQSISDMERNFEGLIYFMRKNQGIYEILRYKNDLRRSHKHLIQRKKWLVKPFERSSSIAVVSQKKPSMDSVIDNAT